MGANFLIMSTMLAGLILWLAFFIAYLVNRRVRAWPPSVRAILCAIAGGLIVFSGWT